jgi:hypothetical protein
MSDHHTFNIIDAEGIVETIDISGTYTIIDMDGTINIIDSDSTLQIVNTAGIPDPHHDFVITNNGPNITNITDLSTSYITITDISSVVPNILPPSGNVLLGLYYAITAQGGYHISQEFPIIRVKTINPINKYDITNALQVTLSTDLFNAKLGSYTSLYNGAIYNRWQNDTISLTASEFVANIATPSQVISLGTYTTLYSDFISYVNNYFSYAGSFNSLFASIDQFDFNNGIFDANAYIALIREPLAITGTITIYNVNNLLQYAVDTNVFGNRAGVTGNSIIDGFKPGDLILVPSGTTITLNLQIDLGSSNIPSYGLNQVSSTTIKYNDSNYRVSTTAAMNNINRVLTAPLVIELT